MDALTSTYLDTMDGNPTHITYPTRETEPTTLSQMTPAQVFTSLDNAAEYIEAALDVIDTVSTARPGLELAPVYDRLRSALDELLTIACTTQG